MRANLPQSWSLTLLGLGLVILFNLQGFAHSLLVSKPIILMIRSLVPIFISSIFFPSPCSFLMKVCTMNWLPLLVNMSLGLHKFPCDFLSYFNTVIACTMKVETNYDIKPPHREGNMTAYSYKCSCRIPLIASCIQILHLLVKPITFFFTVGKKHTYNTCWIGMLINIVRVK